MGVTGDARARPVPAESDAAAGRQAARPLRVVLVGEESAGLQTLRLLNERGDDVLAVLTASAPESPGASVARLAHHLQLPLMPAETVRTARFAQWLRRQRVDVLLNVHSLVVADGEVVEAPRLGSLNLHPGPLPHYAGLNAPSWAVFQGAEEYGVTLHRMAAAVDAGPVVASASFPLGPADTGLSVSSTCVRLGVPLIRSALAAMSGDEELPGTPQDLSKRVWYGKGPPDGGRLRWDRPAEEVGRFVRACDYGPFRSPWGHPRCRWGNEELGVTRAVVTRAAADAPPGTVRAAPEGPGVLVAAADRWVHVQEVRHRQQRVDPADVVAPGHRLVPPPR